MPPSNFLEGIHLTTPTEHRDDDGKMRAGQVTAVVVAIQVTRLRWSVIRSSRVGETPRDWVALVASMHCEANSTTQIILVW